MKQRLPVYRILTACLASIVVAGVAILTLTRVRPDPRADTNRLTVDRNMPAAVARHMKRFESLPGFEGMSGEGPGSAGTERFLARAYPDDDIPLLRIEGARSAAARLKGKDFPSGKGRPDTWISVGPSNALYPFTQFRSSFSYVPNDVRRRRTGHGDRDRSELHAGPLPAVGVCRRRGSLADEERAERPAELGVPLRRLRHPVRQLDHARSERCHRQHAVRRHRRSERLRRFGRRRRDVQVHRRRRYLDRSARRARCSAAGRSAASRCSRETRTRSTRRRRAACAGVSSVTGGAVSLIPGAARLGPVQVHRRRRDLDVPPQRRGQRGGLRHGRGSDRRRKPVLAARRAARRARSVQPRHRLRRLVQPRRLALDRRRRHVDADQAVPRNHPADANMRPEFAVTTLPTARRACTSYEGIHTDAATPSPTARLFRSDDVATGVPVFPNLSSSNPANPGYGTLQPLHRAVLVRQLRLHAGRTSRHRLRRRLVLATASTFSNKRGVVLSTDAGVSAHRHDDGRAPTPLHPNGLHPDQHALVTNPDNPFQFFEVNDGGVMRSSGEFADVSSWCDDPNRGPLADRRRLGRCQQLLSRVPTKLESMNKGLTTLQFQSLSVSPFNVNLLQGGTQDNGTWQTPGNPVKWENTMIGDGGQSGFDVGRSRVPLPHVLQRHARRELQQRRHRRLELDRRSDLLRRRAAVVLRADHLRPGRSAGSMFVGPATSGARRRGAWAP